MKKKYVRIEGIHCQHCIDLISSELKNHKLITNVSNHHNVFLIDYKGNLNNSDIIKIVTDLGYITSDDLISEQLKDVDSYTKIAELFIILFIILVVWFLIYKFLGFNIFSVIPTVDSSVTYGMLFVTGLFTSIHCVSMCGAINLMAILNTGKKKNLKKPILYNLGRVISYTFIGGLCGLIGSVFRVNDILYGIIILFASVFLFLFALSMLELVPYRFQWFYKLKIKNRNRNSFVIGLLNGFMPCGPLQAMQLYALSTGSFLLGSFSMMLFALGTVPLMLFIGIVFNMFRGYRKILFHKIASILILLLSFVMFQRGLLSLNIDIFKAFHNYGNFTASTLVEDYQVVEFDLSYNNYQDIIVQKGIPVKIIIHVDKKFLTGCNEEVVFLDFQVRKKLEEGDNVIEFTPTNEGIYTYTCWMEMITNHIKVVDDKNYFRR